MGRRAKKKGLTYAAIGGAIALAFIGAVATNVVNLGFGQIGKQAIIDYSFLNGDDKLARLVCYINDPNNPVNVSKDATPVPVYLRNRGDIDGKITVTFTVDGGTVSTSKTDGFLKSYPVTTEVPNDKTWNYALTFYVKPDPNQQTLRLSITGVGVGQSEAKAPYQTSYALNNVGASFVCPP